MHSCCKGIVLLFLLVAVSACIPTQRQLRMEQDLEEMKRRLAETERNAAAMRMDQAGETKTRLDALALSQAELQANFDTLRVDFQSLNGRLEDMAVERTRLSEEFSLTIDDLGLQVAALDDRLAKLEEKVTTLEKTPPPAAEAAKTPEAPEALYKNSIELIQKKGEFTKGREQLQEFLKRYPDDPMAVNAMYWIGESFYGDKKYDEAILQFQDVIAKHKDHTKAPAALLKQGLAFYALGDEKDARLILNKVLDSYPDSEEAKKAKERLAEWEEKKTD